MLFTVPPRKPSPWYRPEKVPITVGRADYQRLDHPHSQLAEVEFFIPFGDC